MIPQTEKTYYGYTKIQLLCCMVCYICFLVFGAADTSKSVYLPLIQKFYHLEYDYQGLFVFTSSIGYITLSLFVGYLVVRLGIKITLIMGLSILIISMLGATFFVNIWVLLGFLIIGGCGSVFIDVGSNTWGTMLFQHHKAVMMNILHFFYGLGAAIGAKMGNPDKVVINVAGDGCFRMNMNELATATRNNMALVEVIINNQVLGMVRQWQTLYYEKRYSNTILQDKVDYVKLAEAMGAVGMRVTKKEDLAEAIRKAIDLNTTVLIDCVIDSDDKVFPMVSPGANIEDAFDAEDLEAKEQ